MTVTAPIVSVVARNAFRIVIMPGDVAGLELRFRLDEPRVDAVHERDGRRLPVEASSTRNSVMPSDPLVVSLPLALIVYAAGKRGSCAEKYGITPGTMMLCEFPSTLSPRLYERPLAFCVQMGLFPEVVAYVKL